MLEKHLDKIKAYMTSLMVKLPLPAKCTIEERKKLGKTEGNSSTPMATDLQRTKLSEYLEKHVRTKMEEHVDETVKTKSASDVSSMGSIARKKYLHCCSPTRPVLSLREHPRTKRRKP